MKDKEIREKYPEIEAACAIYNNTGYMDEGFRVSINGLFIRIELLCKV